MAEQGDHLDLGDEPAMKTSSWGPFVIVAIVIVLGIAAFWITREKKNEQARTAILKILDKELSDDEAAVKAQRQKVLDLTRQLDELRNAIQLGDVKDGKKAVAEFNKLVAVQHAERDKFAQMADQYNQKVAKYHQLEQ